ncbi:MAG: chorismate synthase [Bacteroidia bacterium]
MFNAFGNIFRITTFGESHGEGMGVVIDGCPAGLAMDLSQIQDELNKRRPGQNRISTQRKEPDSFQLLSGHLEHVTTGSPLTFWVPNTSQRSRDYDHIKDTFRPSHADYTYTAKYGLRDYRGGGRSSARETLARVIGGSVARQLLEQISDIKIEGWVHSIHDLSLEGWPTTISFDSDIQQQLRCPDPVLAQAMYDKIDAIRKAGNSLGGTIGCRVSNMPTGLGEPIYMKLESLLASAMLSINATKGFEIGSGFDGTKLTGAEHNDVFYQDGDTVRTKTNHSGGVQGGISNGEDVLFKVAFKPTATIMQNQNTVDKDGNAITLKGRGRHDPCVVPRAVPIVEAMAALVLADLVLMDRSRRV